MAAVAILLLGGLGAWWYAGSGASLETQEPLQPSPSAGSEEASEAPPGMISEAELRAMEANGPRTVGGIETRPAGGYEPVQKVFGGSGGTITGEIRVDGADYPETFTVTLEPSRVAEGRDVAVRREFVSEPGMRTFELRDLPLAAYRLSARAPGLATSKIEVALYQVAERPGQRGLDFINIDLTLRPMARVHGMVREQNGNSASGLKLFLTPYEAPGGDRVAPADVNALARLETVTTVAGTFSFDAVAPGPWLLHVGDPIKPLMAPIPVGMKSQDQRLDDLTLPALATLDLIVLDHLARPCPGVMVTGYLRGVGTGSLKGVTDGVGRLEVHHLTPGPWRIEAVDEALGQKGRADLSLSVEGKANGLPDEVHIR